MTDQELRQIVEQVTNQVLAALSQENAVKTSTGAEKILVVGDINKVPREICTQAVLCGLDAYERDRYIAPFNKVIISELTLVQLCDVAQGRPSDTACCAVIQALLNGKSVMLLESGLPHRAFAGKGSTALYARLEDYVRTLSSFGVKLMTEARMYRPEEVPIKPARYQKIAEPTPNGSGKQNYARLITEEIALSLVKDGECRISIPHDAILTPSARDVFTKLHITVERK